MKTLKILVVVCLIFGAYPRVYALDLEPGKNKVSYLNEREKIIAHAWLPKNYVAGQKRPAIILNPPATGVKEQTIGLYAEKLSEKGFIAMAIDPRGFGESEGPPQLQDPCGIAADIRTGISHLRTLPQVDAENVFSFGICAGAGYASFASAFDSRIKALIIVSPFLTTSPEYLELFGNSTNLRQKLLPAGGKAIQKFYETGEDMTMQIVPVTDEQIAKACPIALGMREYYLPGKPGDVPNWKKELSLLSMGPALSFRIYDLGAVPLISWYPCSKRQDLQ